MSRFDKLKDMNLSAASKVVLSTEDGAEIIHYTGEDYEGDTIRQTGIAGCLANLVIKRQLSNNSVIEQLRNDGYLDDYERGTFEFEEYVAATITENGYELGLLEVDTKHYDHKRGYTNVKAELEITLGELFDADKVTPYLFGGWNVAVETPMGTLNVE
tara:strand:+ start:1246 stop:1719 length:474 start_codon:yes stop_codon:yes gene_type:complete